MILQLRLGQRWKFEDIPDETIALAGAVVGTHVDGERRRFSFDHRGRVDWLATSATCQQVLDALLLGLDPSGMQALVASIDANSVLSFWMLQNSALWRDPENVVVVRPLVASVAGATICGPGYPVWDPALVRYFESHVIDPDDDSGILSDEAGPDEEVFRDCVGRLYQWWEKGLVADKPRESNPEIPVLHHFGSWVFLDAGSDDFGIATPHWIYESGHDRIVIAHRRRDRRYNYSIRRRSEFVDGFPVQEIASALDGMECVARGVAPHGERFWNTGGNIGGSHRQEGSVLLPAQVIEMVKAFLTAAIITRMEDDL